MKDKTEGKIATFDPFAKTKRLGKEDPRGRRNRWKEQSDRAEEEEEEDDDEDQDNDRSRSRSKEKGSPSEDNDDEGQNYELIEAK